MPRELSVLGLASATKELNTSGMELPAAMSVAPLTSSERLNFLPRTRSDATKYSSHTTAKPRRQ
jgi:hypothetical protein